MLDDGPWACVDSFAERRVFQQGQAMSPHTAGVNQLRMTQQLLPLYRDVKSGVSKMGEAYNSKQQSKQVARKSEGYIFD